MTFGRYRGGMETNGTRIRYRVYICAPETLTRWELQPPVACADDDEAMTVYAELAELAELHGGGLTVRIASTPPKIVECALLERVAIAVGSPAAPTICGTADALRDGIAAGLVTLSEGGVGWTPVGLQALIDWRDGTLVETSSDGTKIVLI